VDTDDWVSDVQYLVADGLVRVDRVASRFYGRLGARFPIGFNRIDWSQVPNAILLPSPEPKPTLEAYATSVAACLVRIAEWTEVGDDEQVVLLGDASDLALWMSVSILQKHVINLLGKPQHYYLLPPDAGWCFNYTFEDDMYFGCAVYEEGRAPPRRRT
jgi:hypothetical protein